MYQDKIYVCLDNTMDLETYEIMKTWKQSNGEKFKFYDGLDLCREIEKLDDDVVKEKIRSRMLESKVCVVLIGKFTKSYRKFTRWQIECAIEKQIPIIAINANGIRSVDFDRCPTILKKNLAIHISFQEPILEFALENWPASDLIHREEGKLTMYRYQNKVYDDLHLETYDL